MIEIIDCPDLLMYAKEILKCSGKVCQEPSGFVYLKIDDAFIYSLFQLVPDSEKRLPNYFSNTKNSGAHISILYPGETTALSYQSDIGRDIQFEVEYFFKATVRGKTYFACSVDSSEIFKIREKCGLQAKVDFGGFQGPLHFTIAVKGEKISA